MVRVESVGEIRGAIKIQIRYIKPKCTLCVNNPLMKNDYNEDDIEMIQFHKYVRKQKNATRNIS